jgi:hypothetical protein
MIDRAWRALLLAMTILLVTGAPILAQSDDAGLPDRRRQASLASSNIPARRRRR